MLMNGSAPEGTDFVCKGRLGYTAEASTTKVSFSFMLPLQMAPLAVSPCQASPGIKADGPQALSGTWLCSGQEEEKEWRAIRWR